MSKLEKTNFLKTIIITLMVGLFGMISYLVVNIEKIVLVQAILPTVGILVNMLILGILIRISLKKINELENL